MDAIEAIKRRRSIRLFKDKPIPRQILKDLVDAARFAPTARNEQPWQFVVVTEPDSLRKIAEFTDHGRFIAQAKACIAVFCSDTKYYLEDGCAATCNILLAATVYNVGSCWVAGDKKPYAEQVNNLLNVPSLYKLISLIGLGFPEKEDSFKIINKKGLDELTHWEKF